jgi:hypothetical protein
MQKHTINELYEMLKGIMDENHPGHAKLHTPPDYDHECINLGLIHEDIAYTFVLADGNGFVASPGEFVKWDDATPEDMARSVEFADNWFNDKSGEA